MTQPKRAQENVDQHRRDVQSAMYWLVWHRGLSIDGAESLLLAAKGTITIPLAELGRTEGRRCFTALADFAANNDQRRYRDFKGIIP